MENLEVPEIREPSDLAAGASGTQERIWEKQVDKSVKRTTYLSKNIKTLYLLVLGQCTDGSYNEAKGGGVEQFLMVCHLKVPPHSMCESLRHFYTMGQGRHMTTQVHLEQFQNMVDAVTHTGGVLGQQPAWHREDDHGETRN